MKREFCQPREIKISSYHAARQQQQLTVLNDKHQILGECCYIITLMTNENIKY